MVDAPPRIWYSAAVQPGSGEADVTRRPFILHPAILLGVLILVLVACSATMVLQRQALARPEGSRMDRLHVEDYVLGVVQTLATGPERQQLSRDQAERLLARQAEIEREMYGQTVARDAGSPTFETVLTPEQAGLLFHDPRRDEPRLVDPAEDLRRLFEHLRRRAELP